MSLPCKVVRLTQKLSRSVRQFTFNSRGLRDDLTIAVGVTLMGRRSKVHPRGGLVPELGPYAFYYDNQYRLGPSRL